MKAIKQSKALAILIVLASFFMAVGVHHAVTAGQSEPVAVNQTVEIVELPESFDWSRDFDLDLIMEELSAAVVYHEVQEGETLGQIMLDLGLFNGDWSTFDLQLEALGLQIDNPDFITAGQILSFNL